MLVSLLALSHIRLRACSNIRLIKRMKVAFFML